MAKSIVEIFPKHLMYVEGFGGGASVLFRKTPSKIEVYNDLLSILTLFFKTLRDNPDELIKKIQLTPYSREEFMLCKKTWRDEVNEIEKIRKFYVSIMQSIGGTGKSGWSYSKTQSRRGMSQNVSKWLSNVDESVCDAVERLREVQIENLDILDLIKKYDKEDTLFYLDPPYIVGTRSHQNAYDHEMTDEQHVQMIDLLLSVKGMVILSGYDHEIYNKLLLDSKWRKVYIGGNSKRSQKTNDGSLTKGEEFVWINYDIESTV